MKVIASTNIEELNEKRKVIDLEEKTIQDFYDKIKNLVHLNNWYHFLVIHHLVFSVHLMKVQTTIRFYLPLIQGDLNY